MSDEVISNATNPDQINHYMAGFEAASVLNDSLHAHRSRERTRLRGFLRRGMLRFVLGADARQAIQVVLHNDEAALAVTAECDKQASDTGRPLIDWLASVDWQRVLEIILAIVPLFMEKADPAAELAQQAQELGMGYEAPKPAVSPYGVPETK